MSEVRLIDANALRYKNLAEVNGRLTYVLTAEEINNAPTVEAVEFEYHSKLIKQAYQKGKDIRPQGKWIEKYSDYGVYYRCSNCHKMPPNYECDYKEGAIKTNFCPNCGADMRKGGTE